MMTPKILLSEKKVNIMLNRLCCQLIERHGDFKNTVLVGRTLNAKPTEMEVSVESKDVVLIDDVLYTGRSIRSALTAIDSYGRPNSIELLVLVDRRFSRHLPIQPDYLGAQIDALQGDKVKVVWSNSPSENIVYLEKHNE